MNYRGLFPKVLIIFLENNDKTYIASQFKLVFAIITEFVNHRYNILNKVLQFHNQNTLLRFSKMLTRILTSPKTCHIPF